MTRGDLGGEESSGHLAVRRAPATNRGTSNSRELSTTAASDRTSLHPLRRRGRGEHRLAPRDGPDRQHELVPRSALVQVAGGARLDRGHDVVVVAVVRGQHQHACGAGGFAGRSQAVRSRHEQVHQQDIGHGSGRSLPTNPPAATAPTPANSARRLAPLAGGAARDGEFRLHDQLTRARLLDAGAFPPRVQRLSARLRLSAPLFNDCGPTCSRLEAFRLQHSTTAGSPAAPEAARCGVNARRAHLLAPRPPSAPFNGRPPSRPSLESLVPNRSTLVVLHQSGPTSPGHQPITRPGGRVAARRGVSSFAPPRGAR